MIIGGIPPESRGHSAEAQEYYDRASVRVSQMKEAFCASSAEAQALSDGEFWEKVAEAMNPAPDGDWQPDPDIDDYPEMVVGFCLRCGGNLVAEDYQQLRRIVDEDMEICDDCADDQLPDLEEMF